MIRFQDVVFVVNKAKHPLPKPQSLNERDQMLFDNYKVREHLKGREQSSGLLPLTIDERMKLNGWKMPAMRSCSRWESWICSRSRAAPV